MTNPPPTPPILDYHGAPHGDRRWGAASFILAVAATILMVARLVIDWTVARPTFTGAGLILTLPPHYHTFRYIAAVAGITAICLALGSLFTGLRGVRSPWRRDLAIAGLILSAVDLVMGLVPPP